MLSLSGRTCKKTHDWKYFFKQKSNRFKSYINKHLQKLRQNSSKQKEITFGHRFALLNNKLSYRIFSVPLLTYPHLLNLEDARIKKLPGYFA